MTELEQAIEKAIEGTIDRDPLSGSLEIWQRDAIRCFLAAIRGAGFRFERDWMPIESAPKDGTPLLLWMAQPVYSRDIQLYVPWDRAQVAIGWWTGEEWEICWVQEGSGDSYGFTNWFYMGSIYQLPSPPLLWKPLPEGPTK